MDRPTAQRSRHYSYLLRCEVMLNSNRTWVLFINYDHPNEEKWHISSGEVNYAYDTLKYLLYRHLHMYKSAFYFVSIEI